MKRLLFSAYIFAFIAGILVSLATNLFTTAMLSKELTINIYRVYGIALALLISSIGAFGVSAFLETARSRWELGGSPMSSGVISGYISRYIRWILFCLIIFLLGLFTSVFIYVWGDIVFNSFILQIGQR